MVIAVCRHHEPTAIRVCLSCVRVFQRAPSVRVTGFRQPVVLGVGEQHLPMFRWPQDVDPELLRGSGHERAAVRVLAFRGFRSAVGYAGFPVHMFAGGPVRLNVHRIQLSGQARAVGTDLGRQCAARVNQNGECP
jgi:hypothetical protein